MYIILGGFAASNGQDWVEGKTPSNGRKETILTILGQVQKNFGGGGVLIHDGSGHIHFCFTKQIYVFIYFLKISCSCTFHGSTINRRKKADNDAIAISTKNRWWYSVGMYTESGFWGYGYLFILSGYTMIGPNVTDNIYV